MVTWRGPREELFVPAGVLVWKVRRDVDGGLTVTTSAVHLSNIDDLVVTDSDTTASVVLNDLVICVLRSTTDDQNIAVAQSRYGVLADVTEPDIADSAPALAVHTLKCIGTDDDVFKGCTILEEEDGVLGAGVALSALHATGELAVAIVPGLTGGNSLDGLEYLDVADAGGDVERLGGSETSEQSEGEVLHLDD